MREGKYCYVDKGLISRSGRGRSRVSISPFESPIFFVVDNLLMHTVIKLYEQFLARIKLHFLKHVKLLSHISRTQC